MLPQSRERGWGISGGKLAKWRQRMWRKEDEEGESFEAVRRQSDATPIAAFLAIAAAPSFVGLCPLHY